MHRHLGSGCCDVTLPCPWARGWVPAWHRSRPCAPRESRAHSNPLPAAGPCFPQNRLLSLSRGQRGLGGSAGGRPAVSLWRWDLDLPRTVPRTSPPAGPRPHLRLRRRPPELTLPRPSAALQGFRSVRTITRGLLLMQDRPFCDCLFSLACLPVDHPPTLRIARSFFDFKLFSPLLPRTDQPTDPKAQSCVVVHT